MILKNRISGNDVRWSAYDEFGNRVVTYSFATRKAGTDTGQRLVFITLLRYAVLDCLAAKNIKVEAAVTEFEAQYIDQELNHMIDYSMTNQNLELEKPTIRYDQIVRTIPAAAIKLNDKKCYIGYSGGKDSKLCYKLIQDCFDEVIKFKIDFDEEEFQVNIMRG